MYDPSLAGESDCQPHLRVVPFRAKHYQRLINIALDARGAQEAIPAGDAFFLKDAQKTRNRSALMKPFLTRKIAPKAKGIKQIFLT